jgi:uncharacterized membrane protein
MAEKTQLVLSVYSDEAKADEAAAALKDWDREYANKLTSIGVLVLDKNGKLKDHKMGSRSTGKGAGIGLILAVVAPPTLLAGVVAGGLAGALHRKGLGLDGAARDQLAEHLAGGKAAVGVLAPLDEVKAITSILEDMGGQTETHDLDDDALEEADAVAAAEPEAAAPEGAAPEGAEVPAAEPETAEAGTTATQG